jgi:hypothetical protein
MKGERRTSDTLKLTLIGCNQIHQVTPVLGRVFKLTRKEKQSLSSAFDLFVLLEKRGHLTVLNTKCLKDMIKTLENRGDLMDLVTSYQGKFKGVTCSSLPFHDLSPGFQNIKRCKSSVDKSSEILYSIILKKRRIS